MTAFETPLPPQRIVGAFVLAVSVIAAALLGMDIYQETTRPVRPIPYLRPGDPAPALELPDLQGRTRRIDPTAPGLKVVNFSLLASADSRIAVEELDAVRVRLQERPVTFAVVAEDSDAQEAHSFQAEREVGLLLLLDADGEAGRAYGVRRAPTTFLVDESGIIRAIHAPGRASPVYSAGLSRTIEEECLALLEGRPLPGAEAEAAE
jgi:peroxiredoxin